MERKYNAFISYRHAKEDIKIASEVQTQLERFRIPSAIQKKTGIKRFERVFRDKEELPITSDLNDDIDVALQNSDFLIVICSERTGESIWVQKEIDTFLKYHSKKNILTVLVDGEPEEVIPEILRRETVTRKLANGIEETREELIEPLSCDYRIGIKKARKTELPRLAASMLGCSYDELVQRRKQYERRRIGIIASAAALLASFAIGYLIWSLFQIQKNYDLAQFNYQLAQENYDMAQANYLTAQQNYQDSLRNQSMYLASESRELLLGGDRLGAVQLALAALPSDGSDRPVTSEAEFALTEALGSYTTPGLLTTSPVWKYGTGTSIKKFRVDSDNYRIAILDAQGDMMVWDAVSHTLLGSFKEDGHNLNDFIFGENGKLILAYSDEIRVYDTDIETVLWSLSLNEKECSYSADDMMRALFSTSDLLYTPGDVVMLIDLNDGSIKEEHDLEEELGTPDDSLISGVTALESRISYDGSKVAVLCLVDFTYRELYVYDRTESTWTKIGESYQSVEEFRFSEDGEKLIVSYEQDVFGNSYMIYTTQVLAETVRYNAAYDIHTGAELWNVSVPHTLVGFGSNIQYANWGTGEDAVRIAAILFSNKCLIVNEDTGEVLAVKELVSEYIDSYVTVDDSALVIMLRNGLYLNINLKDPESVMSARTFFSERVESTEVYWMEGEGNRFLVQYGGSSYVTEYYTKFYDRTLVPVPESGTDSIVQYISTDDRLVLLASDMTMYCYDTDNCRMEWNEKISGNDANKVTFLCSDGSGNVYYQNTAEISGSEPKCAKFYKVDLESGDISCVLVIDGLDTAYTDAEDGKIFYAYDDYTPDGRYIGVYDMASGTNDKIELVGDIPSSIRNFHIDVSGDGKYALVTKSGFTPFGAYGIDLESGQVIDFGFNESCFASWSPDSSKFVISTVKEATVYETDGGKVFSVASGDSRILDVCMSDAGLIVVQSNGIASLYDDEGNVVAVVDVLRGQRIAMAADQEYVSFVFSDDTLILEIDGISAIIDMSEFKARALMNGLMHYDIEGGNCYMAFSEPTEDFGAFGYFEIKSVEELIALGNDYVGNEVMSHEMMRKYGIE